MAAAKLKRECRESLEKQDILYIYLLFTFPVVYYAKNSKKNYLIGDSLTFSLNISGIGVRPSCAMCDRPHFLFQKSQVPCLGPGTNAVQA